MADNRYLEEEDGATDVSGIVEQFGGKLISDKEGTLEIERPPHGFSDDQQDRLERMIHQFNPEVWIFFRDQSPGNPAQG